MESIIESNIDKSRMNNVIIDKVISSDNKKEKNNSKDKLYLEAFCYWIQFLMFWYRWFDIMVFDFSCFVCFT